MDDATTRVPLTGADEERARRERDAPAATDAAGRAACGYHADDLAQATLDALAVHIAVLDATGMVVAVNAAWRRFAAANGDAADACGRGADYLAVCDAAAQAGTDGAAALAAALRDVLAGRRASFAQEYPCHSPREQRWFAARATRLPGDGPARVAVAHEDITARHLAEAATRLQARLLDQVPAAVVATDPAGIVSHWNAHATALYGWTPAEALGRPIGALLVGPPDRALGRAILARVAAGETWAGEFPARRKDGSVVPVAVTDAALRDVDGTPLGLVGVAVDLTARRAAEAALAASEGRYRMLLEQAADGILVMDPAARFLEVNAQACAMLGYARAELLRLGSPDIIAPADLAARPLVFPESGAGSRVFERRLRRRDGTTFPVEASIRRLPDGGTQAIIRDITARRAATAALRASEAGLAEAQRIAHVGSWEYDPATGTLRWSDEFFRIAGYPPQSFAPTLEQNLALIHPEDRERVTRLFRASAPRGATTEVDFRLVRPDGTVRSIHQRAEALRDPDGHPVRRLGVVHDVTEQRELEGRLRHQATHDPLTGLPNRALFAARLDRALADARADGTSAAVLFLDLDRFKEVNDTRGHQAGDALLVAAAGRLRAALRDGDTLARFGGDEFAVLLADPTEAAAADRAADRLLRALAAPAGPDDDGPAITASVGIVAELAAYARPEDVLRDADVAMYRAKDAGRAGHARFDPALQAALAARVALERDLRGALMRDEFALHYQPIVDLHTGRVARVEALLRWHHPARGPVAPGAFIPLAEETGLIAPLGRWVLGEACRQAAAWAAAGTPVTIAVNLTAREFQSPALATEVAAALAAAGLAAAWLGLEITESLAMHDVAATIATLTALGALGVQVAIDDFGTGYSSLAYLKRLPVRALKIDKTFVDGLGTEAEDTAIVAAIVTLAHTLGLRVVAEGVETAAQAAQLRALGCDAAQGYHFARPLPAVEATALLAAAAPLGSGDVGRSAPGPGGGREFSTGELHQRRERRTARLRLATDVALRRE